VQDIYYPLDKYDAKKIALFLKNNIQSVEEIYVNCEAGISRSAGVAKAICEWLGQPFDNSEFKYIPNERVYQLVLHALQGGKCGTETKDSIVG
jgi:predicted protein tyrosine phosphatase